MIYTFWLYFDLSISCVCNRNAEYKAHVRNQTNRLKIFILLKLNKIKSVQDSKKLETTNRRQKSIQKHKRNSQFQ